ncbi:valine---tRNA ligase [Synchytrium microbalum]|uniref:Probable valine--tRNA ligase, cytoplasmic n=1 Tax=Synchytrium microbalum TaxID=1806994 RepID=A0A507CJR1_9FUNG|nr:valine---tRNA ligase [Synchytrium microbalum]TPX38003.1 valine---tRNA ligase [Synchytrium microbalum]
MADNGTVNGTSAPSAQTSKQAPAGMPINKNSEKNDAKRKAKEEKVAAKQAAAQKALAEKAEKGEKKKPKKEAAEPEVEFVNTTPKGEKKDMTAPMAASYSPRAVEASWYEWWEKTGVFKPELTESGDVKPEGSYVISIPPPNVTGSLHIGHALTNAIQDCLIRWNRMKGKSVLYIPGCDHAGIMTQVVVEKQLLKDRGVSRHDLGREAFVAEVWKWKEKYGSRIYEQLRRLGSTYEWERVSFTLDPKLCTAVNEAFVTLHDRGLIYRANRLVNWCTKLQTAVSNLEVENRELEGRTMLYVPDHSQKKRYEFGVIISFAYPIENSDEKIVVATTRIETMLGDTAVAVNPTDDRYKHLIGKYAIHPFNNRKLPIIADTYVEKDFGTGAVKITPAHDFNDYQIGKRHNLEFINLFNDDGKVNANGAPFAGLQRFDAREAVLAALKEKGLYVETKPNKMMLPICQRSGNVVEPLLKPQWYVDCKGMAQKALEACQSGDLQIFPEHSHKEFVRWMENIQDWCISRQLWWGHRIPTYFIEIKGQTNDTTDNDYHVSGRTYEEARARAVAKFPKVAASDITLHQDEDVLDTWFSAGLWPFAILGWPEETKDFQQFYPNALLETGWDIIFFWVARMVMFGIEFTGQVPFKHVFCHAMIRDAHGRKMSKSLGNVIDPIDVMEGITLEGLQKRLDEGNLDATEVAKAKEGQKADFPSGIPECGTDALRFALCAYQSNNRDINMDVSRVEGYRKFCNKLWNVIKFALGKLGDDYAPPPSYKIRNWYPTPSPAPGLTGQEALAERWILSRLNLAITEINKSLEEYNFMSATGVLYNFWLYELCDIYVEWSKPVIDTGDAAAAASARATLYTCLDVGLRLLHPFMPFVTEELWQRLPRRPDDTTVTICKASYPTSMSEWHDQEAEDNFGVVSDVCAKLRGLAAEYGILKDAVVYVKVSASWAEKFELERQTIVTLVKPAQELRVLKKEDAVPSGCALEVLNEDITVLILVKGYVNFADEISKIEKKIGKANENLESNKKKTQIPNYETKVRADVREAQEQKIKDVEAEIETLHIAKANMERLRDA